MRTPSVRASVRQISLSSAWYTAAAESSPTSPVLLRDVAHRIRAARRFLNYVADQFFGAGTKPLLSPGKCRPVDSPMPNFFR